MPWIDDFEGNKLSHKWVETRLSDGGQNDGVWRREVKDSKLYAVGVNGGTEAGFWGANIALPVNATGDIIIDAVIRHKANASLNGNIGIGINQAGFAFDIRNGLRSGLAGGGSAYIRGFNATVPTPFPCMPSKSFTGPLGADLISPLRIVRKNGYVTLFINGQYVGQFAYAPVITTVDIVFLWRTNEVSSEKWVDWIRIYPRSVVEV
jgi:hypothetical protein